MPAGQAGQEAGRRNAIITNLLAHKAAKVKADASPADGAAHKRPKGGKGNNGPAPPHGDSEAKAKAEGAAAAAPPPPPAAQPPQQVAPGPAVTADATPAPKGDGEADDGK